jgi:hypothetical protein
LTIATDLEQLEGSTQARMCRLCNGEGYAYDDPDGGSVACFHHSGE